MGEMLAGVDVGTSSTKAVVFTVEGREVSRARATTPWRATPPGAEAHPRAVLKAAVTALHGALDKAPEGRVLSVGVTSIGESGVLLDRNGEPCSPLIAWYDRRDKLEVEALGKSLGAARFAARTGLPVRCQWSLTKYRWLLTHYPDSRVGVRWLNVAEWIVRALGGDESAEQSLASRTGWLDLRERRWWPEAIAWSGATESLLPDVLTGGTPLGNASRTSGLGRLQGAVLTVAGHDHQAATVGTGAFRLGDELDSCGTAEALVRTIRPTLDPSAVATLAREGITTGWHVLPGRWCLLGGTQGGLVLKIVLGMLGLTAEEADSLRAAGPPACSPVIDAADAGSITISGVRPGVSREDVWQAALEAVTAQAAKVHSAMSAVAGSHHALVITGGWSRSLALVTVKRRLLGALRVSPVNEAGARGAALLGGLAAGVYTNVDDLAGLDLERAL